MSTKNLKNFLSALENVTQDYKCAVCSELCKNPVTLSKCFHIICGEHFGKIETCPTCNISLKGCTTFVNDRLEKGIESARQLEGMFKNYKTLDDTHSTIKEKTPDVSKNKRGKQKANDECSENDSLNIRRKVPNRSKQDSLKNSTINRSLNIKVNKVAEKRNNKGETMLHIACRLGNIEKVSELLNQGSNTNTKDNAGWTPLHEVVQNGRLDLVQLLLQYNTLINVPGPSNETPLHEAVRYGHEDIAEELVKNGAELNIQNCKGETPLQLATGNMKKILEEAAENILQTQTANVTLISEMHTELDNDDLKVYCVSKYRSTMTKLKSLTKQHDNLHIEAKLTKKVTHLVVDAEDGVCESSLDVLQGIVYGIWIVSSEWISNSTEDHLEPFQRYEVKGVGTTTNSGPKNARYNKYKQLPGIFNGCHFYLHNFNTKYEISKTMVLTKAILTKLIQDAGGFVLRRVPNPESIPESEKLIPYHAKKGGKLTKCSHYIIFKDIYEPMYNMQHLKALPVGWLIECLEKYELCEPW